MTNIEALIAKDLLSIKAVFFRPDEPFTWASGIKSPVYCDNRLTLTAPKVRTDVENSLAEQAGLKKGDKITAMTVKGQKYTITRLHHVVDLGWKLETGDVVSFTIEGKADPINIIITADCFSYVD